MGRFCERRLKGCEMIKTHDPKRHPRKTPLSVNISPNSSGHLLPLELTMLHRFNASIPSSLSANSFNTYGTVHTILGFDALIAAVRALFV
jgi:hypothetical protein